MIDIAFAGLMHNSINCDEVSVAEKVSYSSVYIEQVEHKICNFFVGKFQHVRLTALKVTAKEIIDGRSNVVMHEPVIDEPLAGRVKISWWAATKNEKVVPISVIYALEAHKKVAIFGKDKEINSVIEESDIYFNTVNVAPFLGIKGFLQESPVGKMVTKKAAKGSYIFTEILSPPALIKKNQLILVVIKSAGLSIKAEAIALENGFEVDSVIQVKIKTTGAVLSARIESEKLAYVEI